MKAEEFADETLPRDMCGRLSDSCCGFLVNGTTTIPGALRLFVIGAMDNDESGFNLLGCFGIH